MYLEDGAARDELSLSLVDQQHVVVVVCGRCRQCCRRRDAVAARTGAERRWTVAATVVQHWTCARIIRQAERLIMPTSSQMIKSQWKPTTAATDSDVISFHIYASWFCAAILWVKLLDMFVTLMSLKYCLSAGR